MSDKLKYEYHIDSNDRVINISSTNEVVLDHSFFKDNGLLGQVMHIRQTTRQSPESKKIEEVLSRLELTIYGLSQAMVNTGSVSASSVLDTLTKIKSILEGGK